LSTGETLVSSFKPKGDTKPRASFFRRFNKAATSFVLNTHRTERVH